MNDNSTNPKDTVLMFLGALNKENFEIAGDYLADDLYFNGVMGKRNGAGNYLADMKKMLFKYDIQNTFVNGNDVVILYNINMGTNTIFTVGIYHVEGSRIKTIQVVFDPRPLLQ